jgi:hypothetical protein
MMFIIKCCRPKVYKSDFRILYYPNVLLLHRIIASLTSGVNKKDILWL